MAHLLPVRQVFFINVVPHYPCLALETSIEHPNFHLLLLA